MKARTYDMMIFISRVGKAAYDQEWAFIRMFVLQASAGARIDERQTLLPQRARFYDMRRWRE